MKGNLVLFVVLFAIYARTFAINPSDYVVFYKLNDKSTFSSLINYLGADKEQAGYLKQVFNVTTEELKKASNTGNNKFAESVLDYNLYNTKCVLSENQYRMYLMVLNLSLNNKPNEVLNERILISDINK